MSAALKLNQGSENLSQKPPLGENRPRPVLVWENQQLSADGHREKSKAKLSLVSGQTLYGYVFNNPINFYDPYGLFGVADLPSIPQPVVDAAAGFGDALSFGFTDWVRDQMGTNDAVDKCSGAYTGGTYAGYGLGAGLGGAGLARGAAALGPGGRIIGHPAYGGRTIDGLRSGQVRFGWSRNNGPTLRLGVRNRHVDIVRLRPPRQ